MMETIVLGGGCFWCVEAVFRRLKGVLKVTPGYAGGHTKNPTYDEVASRKSGHAEVIEVEFDPSVIPLVDILKIFFAFHDPTTKDRQGNDVGPEYRSIILCTSAAQMEEVKKFVSELDASKTFTKPIVTEIIMLEKFYEAEESHKEYYEKNKWNPYCQVMIDPKISKLKEKYTKYLK